MHMRIGVLSDTHDCTVAVTAALATLRRRGVRLVLHCGDIAAPRTVRLFAGFAAHFVFGNWDGDWPRGPRYAWAPLWPHGKSRDDARLRRAVEEVGGAVHDPWGDLELEGHKVAWVHGHDRALLQELEQSGCYDYLFYGHTHRAAQHRRGGTRVVNPGALFKVARKTFAVLDLDAGEVEWVAVPG
jgi:putative phosphoesterase